MSEILITPEGYERLKRELEELKTVKRREIVERIKAARALGDLSENFDYQDAKRQQAFLEGRIKDLETVLSRAKVVPRPDNAGEVVHLGSKVTLHDLDTDKERTIAIVGSFEADPLQDLISILSPLGEAVLGRTAGEEVAVNTPKASCATESCASSSRNPAGESEPGHRRRTMARVTLLIGLTNGQEIDCPINSRDEAQQVIEELRVRMIW